MSKFPLWSQLIESGTFAQKNLDEAYSNSDRETVARLVSKTLTGTIYPPGKTPEEMINNAIKVWLSKDHTSNQWNIGAQMLQRAQTVGIKWDINLMRRKFADFMLKKWGLVEETDTMTDAQMKKREEIVKSMKDQEQDFKDRYGDRWKDVMYATATKQAMSEAWGNEFGTGFYVMKGEKKGNWSHLVAKQVEWHKTRDGAEQHAIKLNRARTNQDMRNGNMYWVALDEGKGMIKEADANDDPVFQYLSTFGLTKKNMLRQYRENEAANAHTDNALMLTIVFGTPAEIEFLVKLKRIAERDGGLDPVKYKAHIQRIDALHSKYYPKLMSLKESRRKNTVREATDTAYQKHFRAMLTKHGYNSPADIPADKKDDFFNAVDASYTAKNEAVIAEAGDDAKDPMVPLRLQAAIVIAKSLGTVKGSGQSVDFRLSASSPEAIVNQAVRLWLSGSHTNEGWALGAKMLKLAKSMGIKWDEKLIQRKLAPATLKKLGLMEYDISAVSSAREGQKKTQLVLQQTGERSALKQRQEKEREQAKTDAERERLVRKHEQEREQLKQKHDKQREALTEQDTKNAK